MLILVNVAINQNKADPDLKNWYQDPDLILPDLRVVEGIDIS